MFLEEIKLSNFKNYSSTTLKVSNGINCFVGQNGMGKTNLLDAIYYLCMCKSNFGTNDRHLIKHEEGFFRLEGIFNATNDSDSPKQKIVAKVQSGKKKVIEKNDVPYKRLMEHIGFLPAVMIVPDDTRLVTEGSEDRRRFIDNTLSQSDRNYLEALMEYNKVLRHRNAALKAFAKENNFNQTLLNTYNQQLVAPAKIIFEKRTTFIQSFEPLFLKYYQLISDQAEPMGINYVSQLQEESLDILLDKFQQKDSILQRTTAGIHKDDLKFTLDNYPLKQVGSQGQIKSFVLALQLAKYEVLKKEKGNKPILLLDDIFDKLDKQRVTRLINLFIDEDFGQVFISDTHQMRIQEIMESIRVEIRTFVVSNGAIGE